MCWDTKFFNRLIMKLLKKSTFFDQGIDTSPGFTYTVISDLFELEKRKVL